MIVLLTVIILFITGSYLFMRQPKFGAASAGERLKRKQASPHYKKGAFTNVSFTPQLTDGHNFFGVLYAFLFKRSKAATPPAALPSVQTNLKTLDRSRNWLVWFGHSSYFMLVDGKTFLVDPVLSGAASPIKATTRSFAGSDVYMVEDLPPIDFLIITHDHWDHLDYETVVKLKPMVGKIITSLGVGAHLERWGFPVDTIHEMDWNEQLTIAEGFTINSTTTRHFSGRGFQRNGSLWSAFVLQTPTQKLYIGGDSGYDTHFKTIGETFGPFDVAILENGQYNAAWKHIHMMPEEVVQAAIDLGAKRLLPVHWGKFTLALHAWDEPIKRAVIGAEKKGVALLHPLIGEAVNLDAPAPQVKWWEGVK